MNKIATIDLKFAVYVEIYLITQFFKISDYNI